MSTLFFVGCSPKDADIKTAVEEKLKTNTDMMSPMTVSVTDGVATISGECMDAACKTKCGEMAQGVKGVKSVVNNCTVKAPMTTAPVIAVDDALTKGVMDATKDHPTVKAEVVDGVIILTGDLKRSELPGLMKTLNTLKAKKIENKLTIK